MEQIKINGYCTRFPGENVCQSFEARFQASWPGSGHVLRAASQTKVSCSSHELGSRCQEVFLEFLILQYLAGGSGKNTEASGLQFPHL